MILGIGFSFLQIPLNVVYNLINGDEYQIALDFQWNDHFSLNTFGLVFFIPIAEELFFRQFLQKELAMKYPVWLSIVLSALLFALIHLGLLSIIAGGDLNWHSAYISLFGGFIAASLFHFSKSIGPAILFHVFWNASVAVF
ncbi:CPBP family intramembrane glutamic endopeptidase [Croceimicrobium hydrocarbonivorans]|uniref:CPBP family intramembrane metalloprotease n=1 Tax=Croceimicrobium hydrocarbonivorans TaxID=2761580 RepID=A0A7H0VJ30_9FLAO|nr:CPBP family intramembrane glutamic endopeptidase [Croceimicrobium hydrocarbonivorans]QNR25728.1 CPBP family intramembrane metalloprotease [Croceimicrobium hydrocarbonivorans]